MKKLTLSISGLLCAISSFAQENLAQKSFMADPFNHPMMPFYLVFALLFISILLVTVITIYVLKIVRILNEQILKDQAQKLGITYVSAPGWWARFRQKMNASVPVEHEKDIELGHSYDGIKELDNHLPPWWKWLFYGTIGWSVVYIFVFHFSSSLPLSLDEYQNEITLAEEQAKLRKANHPEAEAIDESNLAFSNDAAIIEKGKNVFTSNPCGSCHRSDGGGNTIGPNLTDEYWIHGGDVKNIFNTIKNGAVEKGMPAWGKAMSQQDLRNLTFYIMSLQGTNPPDAKAPQGELFKHAASVKTDSTKAQASL
jgi:cytochrome c oxidase cbb3-type subunit III